MRTGRWIRMIWAALLCFALYPVIAQPTLDSSHYVPVDKGLSQDWYRSLWANERKPYRGKELATIGMPCGGIAAGSRCAPAGYARVFFRGQDECFTARLIPIGTAHLGRAGCGVARPKGPGRTTGAVLANLPRRPLQGTGEDDARVHAVRSLNASLTLYIGDC